MESELLDSRSSSLLGSSIVYVSICIKIVETIDQLWMMTFECFLQLAKTKTIGNVFKLQSIQNGMVSLNWQSASFNADP